jgi:hypothetical protein
MEIISNIACVEKKSIHSPAEGIRTWFHFAIIPHAMIEYKKLYFETDRRISWK